MIDKLCAYEIKNRLGDSFGKCYPSNEELMDKINELIEAYNKSIENGVDTECYISGKYVRKTLACVEVKDENTL